ncbi:lim domain family [Anaeramoeba flamelloides]|uniref:Lim domain family n=1 Tax=Anaeramoeba flamelloides TaxID=1746091 RepID=A0AAV7YM29_9EUKA|nr:lim domain family [Anaeramoeba flamelloides]|eukprot:Anaeramoba_flamelloidesa817301_132.p1 GENE.a817301_132~~a817301_132.p1  ORF type:complete len:188 (+),score=36.03 a817301_132:32-595(+)
MEEWTCAKCNKVVQENVEVFAMDKHWHNTCFRCDKCNIALNTRQFAVDQDKPYCTQCFEKMGLSKGSGGFYGKNSNYSQSGGTIGFTKKQSQSSNQTYSGNCYRCGEDVMGNVLKVNGKTFHRKCFVCKECQHVFGKDDFYLNQDEFYCENCVFTVTVTDRTGNKFTAYTPDINNNLPKYDGMLKKK